MNSQPDAKAPQGPLSRQPIDGLIEPKWIVTVNQDNDLLTGHAIAIDQGKILDILPAEQARARFQPKVHHTLDDHAVLPGLINTHGHAAMTLFRGMADDLPLMEWLEKHIWPAEQAYVNERFVADGTALAVAEMIRTGTTCFSDMYFYPETAADEVKRRGMRAQICVPVLDFPTNWGTGPDDYLNKGKALIERMKGDPMIQIALGPHAPYTVSDAPLSEIARLANALDVRIQIHLHETAFEVAEAEKHTGMRPLERLRSLGLLSSRLQCVHMTQLTDSDMQHLEETGAHVVHCPESNLKLASGFCPTDQLFSRGINVALGTDGASSNNNLDMFEEMRTAALLAKGASGNACALSAPEAIRMATINGARALGLDDQIGSLVPGKQADLVAVNLGSIYHQPVYDPVSHLVYCASGKDVTHSWIAGELLLDEGKLTQMDIAQLAESASQWAGRIRKDKETKVNE